jgi:hypothetical protein
MDEKKLNELLKTLKEEPEEGLWQIKLFVGLPLVIISMIVWALCFQTLWGWFIVPLGVTPISAVHAYGISLVNTTLLSGIILTIATKGERYSSLIMAAGTILALPLLTLIGYVISFWM